MTAPSLFSLLFGWGGKTGINCFVLVTGYFMCQSKISIRKFMKLLMQIEFYKIVIYLLFLLSGYAPFRLKEFVKTILPIYGLGTGFTASYMVFYLFIPYLNLLIGVMDEARHLTLMGLCLMTGTVLQTFLKAPEAFTYVGWFMVLYMIASYIRLYPKKLFCDKKLCGGALIVSLLLSWGSVVAGAWVYSEFGKGIYYHFVSDSNKLLAVVTAVSAFLFFKNLNMGYHKLINKTAASTFGVLMIHANSDIMRQWLWQDMLKNVFFYHSNFFIPHAIGSVLGIYIICTLIDMLRIRFVEKPFLSWYDDKVENNLTHCKTHY